MFLDIAKKKIRKAKESAKYHKYAKRRITENLAIWNEYLAKKGLLICVRCGYNEFSDAIHFHHADPNVKKSTIGKLKCHKPTIEAIVELNKCIPLCANCHAALHHNKWKL